MNPGAPDSAALLTGMLGRLDEHALGLTPRIVRYVLTGADDTALLSLPTLQGDTWFRQAMVADPAWRDGYPRLLQLDDEQVARWADVLLHVIGTPRQRGAHPRGSDLGWLHSLVVDVEIRDRDAAEPLAAHGYDAAYLERLARARQVGPDRLWPTLLTVGKRWFGAPVRGIGGFRDVLHRYAGTLGERFDALDPDRQEYQLRSFQDLSDGDLAPLVDILTRAASGTAAGVREAARPLVARAGAAAVPTLPENTSTAPPPSDEPPTPSSPPGSDRDQLEQAMREDRTWQVDDWQRDVVQRLGHLATRVVWQAEGATHLVFRPSGNGTLLTVTGGEVRLPERWRVRIARTETVGAEAAHRWRASLVEHGVDPLLEQFPPA